MTLESFIGKRFRGASLEIIETANQIIDEYQDLGFRLTLRQLYYQFVARDIIANSQKEYKRLGSIINDGRLAGMIDWEAIEDRTRNVRTHSSWDDPADIIEAAARGFALDLWDDHHPGPLGRGGRRPYPDAPADRDKADHDLPGNLQDPRRSPDGHLHVWQCHSAQDGGGGHPRRPGGGLE